MAKTKPRRALLNILTPIDRETGQLNAVVETPAGSRNKFKFDPKLNLFLLHKVLPAGASFPFDFGYIPGTQGDDGDPLDILLLLDVPVFTGCLVQARLIGVLEAKQTEDGETMRNDRLIGVAAHSKDYAEIDSVKEISKNLCQEIEHFFVSYNMQAGRTFKPLGFHGPTTARSILDGGIKSFKGKGGKS